MDAQYIHNTLKTYYDKASETHEVFFLALYGSQNYGLDTEDSDVDVYGCYIPDKRKLLFGMDPDSVATPGYHDTVLTFPIGECHLKDIRKFMQTYLKQGYNFMETLYTPYYMVNPHYQEEFEQLRADHFRNTLCNLDTKAALRVLLGHLDHTYQLFMVYPKTKSIIMTEENPNAVQPKLMARFLYLEYLFRAIIANQPFQEAIKLPEDFQKSIRNIRLTNQMPEHPEQILTSKMEELKHLYSTTGPESLRLNPETRKRLVNMSQTLADFTFEIIEKAYRKEYIS